MLTSSPLLTPPEALPRSNLRSPPRKTASAVHYVGAHNSRLGLLLAMLASAALHTGILLGFNRHHQPVAPPVEEEAIIAISLPQLKDLEEPEPVPRDADAPPPDPGTLVPMQQDVPQLARPSDFIQMIDISTLIPKPDYTEAKTFNIPAHIARGGKIGEGLVIFDLASLDRVPEPIVQPAPIFPSQLKREVERATVRVEFIVDPEGRVLNPFVVDSTHPGFNDAAMAGVSRWKFRAGVKNGRKVYTRMQVPIIFKLVNEAYD